MKKEVEWNIWFVAPVSKIQSVLEIPDCMVPCDEKIECVKLAGWQVLKKTNTSDYLTYLREEWWEATAAAWWVDVEGWLLGRGLSHCLVMPKAVDIEPERRLTEEPHQEIAWLILSLKCGWHSSFEQSSNNQWLAGKLEKHIIA